MHKNKKVLKKSGWNIDKKKNNYAINVKSGNLVLFKKLPLVSFEKAYLRFKDDQEF